jgi:hypothetical protein
LSKVLGDDAPVVSSEQDRAVWIRAPRSMAHSDFRTPLAFRSLGGGGGGGGPGSGAHLSDGPDERAQINGDEDLVGPPPPAFLPLSGGGGSDLPCAPLQRPRSRRPDQRRSCSPALLNCHMINQRGPSFCHFILPSTFPLLPRVIRSPLLFSPRGSPFFPPSAHSLPRVPFLSTSVSHPKAGLPLPFSLHLPGCLPPWGIFLPPLSVIAPSSRHSYHPP